MIKAWTDYPLYVEDDPSKTPIRKVEVLDWDGDKYANIKYNNELFSIKAGYLYSEKRKYTAIYSPKRINRKRIPLNTLL